MSKTNMIKKYVEEDLPGGKELLLANVNLGTWRSFSMMFFSAWLGLYISSYIIDADIKRGNLNIETQEFFNVIKGGIDYYSWWVLIGFFLNVLIGILVYYYHLNEADKVYRKAIEKGYIPLPIEKSRTTAAEADANTLNSQKSRLSDFLSKLDERFISKEISDQNYKELKAKYETQLKDTEKQIVDVELHK